MNVLFVLYAGFDSNSAIHVHNFANQLDGLGCHTAVAVPGSVGSPSLAALGERRYRPFSYDDLSARTDIFPDGRGPDVVHAWTPRERVRLACARLAERWPFTLVIHLEDNEELLLERMMGRPFAQLAGDSTLQVPDTLSHPRHHRNFLSSASGITVIVERLAEFVPAGVAWHVVAPGVDLGRFHPRPPSPAFAATMSIPAGHVVLGYTGNVHPVNAREVRSVYLAAALLTREGVPTVVLRTGRNFCAFLGDDPGWAQPHAIELGFVPYPNVPDVLASCDVLVQPGRPDRFNDYRFPSKLPEYLAMGKPVILPLANLGRSLTHEREALVFPDVDAVRIVEAVQRLAGDPELRRTLGQGAAEFARRNLSWPRSAAGLKTFYESCRREPPPVAVERAAEWVHPGSPFRAAQAG